MLCVESPYDDFAVVLRQPGHGLVHRRVVAFYLAGQLAWIDLLPIDGTTTFRGPESFPRNPLADPQQPGEKRLGLLEFVQGEECPYEYFLGGFGRSVRTAQASV